MSWERIRAVFQRHLFVFRRNPSGWVDLFLWPTVDLLVWGLVMVFIQRSGSIPIAVGFFLGAVLLWTLMFRTSVEVATSFLDDTSWTHNILNLMVAPLRPVEYLAGVSLWAVAKVAVGWTVMTGLALTLFNYSVFEVGLPLVMFMLAVMLFGFAMSFFVLGIVMRLGHGADILAWGLTGLLTPLSAVWYPIEVMPKWAQAVAGILPSAQAFEGMRTVMAGESVPWSQLGRALGLDAVYIVVSLAFAAAMFRTLRRRGFVTRYM